MASAFSALASRCRRPRALRLHVAQPDAAFSLIRFRTADSRGVPVAPHAVQRQRHGCPLPG
ncbi:hypothetical protein AQF52_7293 [Streptomyces venezuelae]|nr:hypothetical protein AQF52_7293 [Streptomyces venezuelae]